MEKQTFYHFGSKLVSRTLLVHAMGLPEGKNEDMLLKGNYEGIDFPVVFKKNSGKRLEDILNTAYPGFYIISEHMKAVLVENELTGWQTFLIQIFDKQGNEISGYHGFSTLGRSGRKDYSQSEVVERQRKGGVFSYYKGYEIDVSTWDGSDFFIPQHTKGTLVTERAEKVIQQAKLTNVSLRNIADIEMDCFNVCLWVKEGIVLG